MWNRIKENSIVLFIILATVIAAVLLQSCSRDLVFSPIPDMRQTPSTMKKQS